MALSEIKIFYDIKRNKKNCMTISEIKTNSCMALSEIKIFYDIKRNKTYV